jgi:hypothetical protein
MAPTVLVALALCLAAATAAAQEADPHSEVDPHSLDAGQGGAAGELVGPDEEDALPPEDESPLGAPPDGPGEGEPAAAGQRRVTLWGGLGFSLEGYYRARGVFVRDLHMAMKNPASTNPELKMRGDLNYLVHRLRLEPVLSFRDLVKLEVWIHALDGVIWGDNAGLSSVGALAGEPSHNVHDGSSIPSITVPAAWVEVNVVVGALRVGRMPSEWGLGLLTDDGSGFDDDFGWNESMDVYDRVLFATMPVAIGQKIAGSEAPPFPLYLAVAYDKLVTDDANIGGARIPYNANWLADYDDDVDSVTTALVYRGEGLSWVGEEDALSLGMYYVHRWQRATRTLAHIVDGFFTLRLGPAFAEGELYWILGESQGLPLRPEVPDGPEGLYERAELDISSWLVRAGLDWWRLRFKLTAGYASGDDDPGDEVFKVRPANPNVSIGLVLYDLMLAERSRTAWAAEDGMWSRGGVYNSYFFMQTVRYEPIDGLEVIVAFLQAWKDEEDGGVYPRRDERFLGFETDIAVKYHFHGDHAHVGIEGGVLHLGKAFKDPALNMPDDTWTIQLWTAFTP